MSELDKLYKNHNQNTHAFQNQSGPVHVHRGSKHQNPKFRVTLSSIRLLVAAMNFSTKPAS